MEEVQNNFKLQSNHVEETSVVFNQLKERINQSIDWVNKITEQTNIMHEARVKVVDAVSGLSAIADMQQVQKKHLLQLLWFQKICSLFRSQLGFIYFVVGCFASHGYWIDMVICHIDKIEGQAELIEHIHAPEGHAVNGSKIWVTTKDNKKVKLLLYNKVEKFAMEKSKMVKGDKFKTVYHYLKLSKVVVDIEYERNKHEY